MNDKILNHYLEFGLFTNPGLYKNILQHDLPDNIQEIGSLVRKNIIHRTTLEAGNVGTNYDLKFGDMKQVPWYRQPEDDNLPTTPAMLAELYRRDARGLTPNRKVEDKLILTCRFVSILTASILKSKGIPARVRSGNAPYFDMGSLGDVSTDHWINQYWKKDDNRWVTIDVDGSLSLKDKFNPYDMPNDKFDFPAVAWLNIRSGKVDPDHFYNASSDRGAIVVVWSLFYDFHSLMNDEVIYSHVPEFGTYKKFKKLSPKELEKIDMLAKLMLKPDENFDKLLEIWNTDRDLRLLKGGLL
ncbi:MAG: transglutaminase domain-containing protein [Patescibacteria group bacterium]|jgi:hypothetical protein